MARRLYVGNLSFNTNEQTLTRFGSVKQVKIVTDRETGQSRGFGFVEFASDNEGNAAIQGMNGQKLDGRALTVNEAKEREARR